MFYLTYAMLLAGAIVLIRGAILVARAIFDSRRGKAASICDYFGPEYDRDLLRHSEFSESEDWLADRHSRFASFRLRETGTEERRTRVNGATE